MNWFEEGREAAEDHWRHLRTKDDDDPEDATPQCPWPIYASEGSAWLRGWNLAAFEAGLNLADDAWLEKRPLTCGHLFHPDFA